MAREQAERADAFCARYGLGAPVLLAPMAGACPVGLSIAVANAGGMGAMGALTTAPAGIREWVDEFRTATRGPLQLNTWMPDPPPQRDSSSEARVRDFMRAWGPDVPQSAGDVTLPDVAAQCAAFLELKP